MNDDFSAFVSYQLLGATRGVPGNHDDNRNGKPTACVGSGDPGISGQDLSWTPSPVPYSLAPGSTIVISLSVLSSVTPGTYSNLATIEGDEFGAASTVAAAPVTLSSVTLTAITPNQGCNDAPVTVTISGTNFLPGITARLGGWVLSTTWVNETTLTAIVPQDIAAGLYDLIVTNPGGASSTQSGAYTVQNCGSPPDTTLDSGYLGTYGAEDVTSARGGDDDQVQVLFLEVPDGLTDPLYIRVYDPDCGGTLDRQGWVWDTPFTYTVYGGSGAYEMKQRLGFQVMQNNHVFFALNNRALQWLTRRFVSIGR